ncbi:hypothetical protein Tsubulata_003418 [Turnera subulata]|uniref:DUF4283 domain-containing protein n=1 Tax=Turnera subulata TaxID=218843 RepID=A0A9Q0FFE2_9ROSI|nr:hypothetical protein Tsubulata_003418 [Turnera subulata]
MNRMKSGKSFAQSVTEQKGPSRTQGDAVFNSATNLVFCPLIETMDWLSCCAFGILASPMERLEVQELFVSRGMPNITVSELGGEAILVHFQSAGEKESFLLNPPEWNEDHFQLFRAWQQGDGATNRKCWIQLKGVPLQAWCRNFFTNVSSRFGDLIKVDVKGSKSVVKCEEVPEFTVPKVTFMTANHIMDDLFSLESSPIICSPKTARGKLPVVVSGGGPERSVHADCHVGHAAQSLESDPFNLREVIKNLNVPTSKTIVSPRRTPTSKFSAASKSMSWMPWEN